MCLCARTLVRNKTYKNLCGLLSLHPLCHDYFSSGTSRLALDHPFRCIRHSDSLHHGTKVYVDARTMLVKEGKYVKCIVNDLSFCCIPRRAIAHPEDCGIFVRAYTSDKQHKHTNGHKKHILIKHRPKSSCHLSFCNYVRKTPRTMSKKQTNNYARKTQNNVQ